MDADTKKTVLRMIPYGIYVLTSSGEAVGYGTVSWISQMSFGPPLLALGVRTDSRNFANLTNGGAIALSFLAAGQGDLAFAFMRDATVEADRFVIKDQSFAYERAPSGAPVLLDAVAWADLKAVDMVAAADHAVVVAEVTDVGLRVEQPEMLTLKELGLIYGG